MLVNLNFFRTNVPIACDNFLPFVREIQFFAIALSKQVLYNMENSQLHRNGSDERTAF